MTLVSARRRRLQPSSRVHNMAPSRLRSSSASPKKTAARRKTPSKADVQKQKKKAVANTKKKGKKAADREGETDGKLGTETVTVL